MTDVDRIAPPVPTLPPAVGREVGSKQRRPPRDRPPRQDRGTKLPPDDHKPVTDHIDEYV